MTKTLPSTRRTPRTGLLGVVLSLAIGGCQTFVPARAMDLEAGTPVRVTLTRAEAARQAEQIGELTDRVQGTVVDADSDSALSLTIPMRGSTPATGTRLTTYLAVPTDEILLVETRVFSWQRTALLVAGGVLATVGILSVREGGSDPDGGEGPPTDSDLVIPIFQFRH